MARFPLCAVVVLAALALALGFFPVDPDLGPICRGQQRQAGLPKPRHGKGHPNVRKLGGSATSEQEVPGVLHEREGPMAFVVGIGLVVAGVDLRRCHRSILRERFGPVKPWGEIFKY